MERFTLEQCLERAYQYGLKSGDLALHAVEPRVQDLSKVLEMLNEITAEAADERK